MMKRIFVIAVMLLLLSGTGNAKKLHVKANTGSNGPFDATAEWTVDGGGVDCAEDSATYSINPNTNVDLYCTSDSITGSPLSGTIAFSPIASVICNAIIAFSYSGGIELVDMWEKDNEYNKISLLKTHPTYPQGGDWIYFAVEDSGDVEAMLKADFVSDTIRSASKWRIREVEEGTLGWKMKNTVIQGDFSGGDEVDVVFEPSYDEHIDFDILGLNIEFEKRYALEVGVDRNDDGDIDDAGELVSEWNDIYPDQIKNVYRLFVVNENDISAARDKATAKSSGWLTNLISAFAAYNLARFLDFETVPASEFPQMNPTEGTITIGNHYSVLQYPAGADFSKSNNVKKVIHSSKSEPANETYESRTLRDAINKVLENHESEVSNHFKSSSTDHTFSDTINGLDFFEHEFLDHYMFYAMGTTEGTIDVQVTVGKDGEKLKIKSIKISGALEDLYDWLTADTPFPIQLQWNDGKEDYGKIFYNVIELDHEFTEWGSYSYNGVKMSNFQATEVCPIA